MAFMLSSNYGSGLREIKTIAIYMKKWNGHAEIAISEFQLAHELHHTVESFTE